MPGRRPRMTTLRSDPDMPQEVAEYHAALARKRALEFPRSIEFQFAGVPAHEGTHGGNFSVAPNC